MPHPAQLPPQTFVVLAALAVVGLASTTLFPRPAPAAGRAAPIHPAPVEPPARPVPAELPARPAPAPSPQAKKRPSGYLIVRARVDHDLVVRSAPGGPVVARLGRRTEFGSPLTVSVVRKHGRWLGVVTTALPNGRLGWVDSRSRLRVSTTRLSLVLDLSARRLLLRDGGRVLRRMSVGVGRSSSPTPAGRFAVTDRLRGGAYGPYYGCCILALSAHQPNLPAGWRGGDRIAIHGTNDPSSIGAATSAGCPHARDADLRVLMRRIPLGTPVIIRH
jgi:lipoprotein-anchoring transpeptidase ErfK/SrfK